MQNVQEQEDDFSGPFVAPFTWDDDDWKIWNAMVAFRDQAPAVAPREDAATAGAAANPPGGSNTIASIGPVICQDIDSIPPGRQPSAILQCGMCMSPHLYARKADLKRHMETHQPGTHFCHVNGCSRGPSGKGFTRVDKLNEHLKKIHGLQGSSSPSH